MESDPDALLAALEESEGEEDSDLAEDTAPLSEEGVRQVAEVEATIDKVQSAKTMEMNLRGESFRLAMETHFYACVVFQNQDQRDAWLRAEGLEPGREINGLELARRRGIALPTAPPFNQADPIRPKWEKLTK